MLKNLIRRVFVFSAAFSLTVSPLLAQTELGTALKRHYRLRAVACNACHLKGDDEEHKSRDALTEFGNVAAKLVEGKRVTERLDEVEEGDSDVKKQVQEAIEAEFVAALKKLDELKTPGGKTWSDAIRAGEVEGIKPRN